MAYLVGERTYGKGSVQQVVPLSNIDGIKLTMARYYTPSDTNIDKVGIPPDLEVLNLQKFTDEEEKLYVEMINSKIITDTVDAKPGMNESDIVEAAAKIAKDYPFEERLLRRLLRVQVQKSQPSVLYDMDWDLQLKEAIRIVQSPEYSELVKSTKTLKQLQEEVSTSENAENK